MKKENFLQNLVLELEKKKNPSKAKVLAGFFKTKKGEYGQGDIFWGITVPETRKVTKKYLEKITFSQIKFLLKQKIHELRFAGVVLLVEKYKKENKKEKINEKEKEKIVKFYLKNLSGINNWDLVDLSAPQILGDYFLSRNKEILYQLARSKNLWERRVAVLATFGFIKENQFSDALRISEILLSDREDLLHKAVGWMLREIGKRDKKVEENFLKKNKNKMARTTLRYAIEKFSFSERKKYLKH